MEEMHGQLVANTVMVTTENRLVMAKVQCNILNMQAWFQALEVGVPPMQVSVASLVDAAVSPAGVGALLGTAVSSSVGTVASLLVSQVWDLNNELLVMKLALEEWCHWLEGAKVPFLVWTDHRDLEYIHSAKRRNSRPARWSLFFNRFNFTLSYRPSSHIVKPDALSHQFLKI